MSQTPVHVATAATAIRQWQQQSAELDRQWDSANDRLVSLLTEWTNTRQSLRHVDTPLPWGELAQVPYLADAAHTQMLAVLAGLRARADRCMLEMEGVVMQQQAAVVKLQQVRDALLVSDMAIDIDLPTSSRSSSAAPAPSPAALSSSRTHASAGGYLPSRASAPLLRVLSWAHELAATSMRALAVKRLAFEGIVAPTHGALRARVGPEAAAEDPGLDWVGVGPASASTAALTAAAGDGVWAQAVLAPALGQHAEGPCAQETACCSSSEVCGCDQRVSHGPAPCPMDGTSDLSPEIAAASSACPDSAIASRCCHPHSALPTPARASLASSAGSSWSHVLSSVSGTSTGAFAGAGGSHVPSAALLPPFDCAPGSGLAAATGELPPEGALRGYLHAVSLEPGRDARRRAQIAGAVEQMLRSQLALV